jgi:hypothetical protein
MYFLELVIWLLVEGLKLNFVSSTLVKNMGHYIAFFRSTYMHYRVNQSISILLLIITSSDYLFFHSFRTANWRNIIFWCYTAITRMEYIRSHRQKCSYHLQVCLQSILFLYVTLLIWSHFQGYEYNVPTTITIQHVPYFAGPEMTSSVIMCAVQMAANSVCPVGKALIVKVVRNWK